MVTAADRLRAEGGSITARENVKQMFRIGLNEAQIKEVTKLSMEEIAELKAELVKEI